MSAEIWWLLAVVILLIVASAFFSSAETALTAASDARMRQLASKGNRRALLVEKLRADREGLIGTILIGNNAVNVIASALATSVAISLFQDAAQRGTRSSSPHPPLLTSESLGRLRVGGLLTPQGQRQVGPQLPQPDRVHRLNP